MLADRGDSGHGDPELYSVVGLQAYCFDCRHVDPAVDFKVIGGDLGAKQCPRCHSLRVAIEGLSEPDVSICEVKTSVVITDEQKRSLISLLRQLGLVVGKGKLAEVSRNKGKVIVAVPRVLMITVISAMMADQVGVPEDMIECDR